ncbi:MAG: right-handed parallel beta-helix repeat-containing protein [Candidatus Zhuqueibacterota bacterium]
MKMNHLKLILILAMGMGLAVQSGAQEFDFNDGTKQGWTMQGAYDESGNGPYSSNFTLSWTSLVNYPTTGSGNGSLLFFTSGGHGITGSSGTYWIMKFSSPDLSGETDWQSVTSISVRLTENMTVSSTLYANLIVTVYDNDLAKDRTFYNDQLLNQPLTYSSWFNSNAVWNTLTFDWSSSSIFPTNYTMKEITIQIMGAMTGLIDGQVGIDEVVGQGGTSTSSITVTNPNGGEQWEADTPQAITWTGQGIDNYDVKIEYSTDGGANYSFVTYQTNHGTAGSYTWTLPDEPSTNCLVRLSVLQASVISDVSNASFEITSNPYIKLDVPNGGENWNVGSPRYIVWNTHLFSGAVKIEYSTNGGATYSTIAGSYSGSPSYQWTVPNTPSSNCCVKVSDATDGQPFDISDAVFTISSTSPTNTPAGVNVIVDVTSAIQLMFAQVINPGNTDAAIEPIGPIPPAYHVVIPEGNPGYYLISTTATYSGVISMEITYSDAGLGDHETTLKLMRFDEPSGQWAEITTHLYTDVNVIRGETDHLSTFAIMYPLSGPTTGSLLVTNCMDAGPGSLRDAINSANSSIGPDTILFAIPEGVPGHDADVGVWIISPLSQLPTISDNDLFLNGFSQAAFIGRDCNPHGPEIVISGSNAGQYVSGLNVTGSMVFIHGLTINNFYSTGVSMDNVDGGHLRGCYIGADFNGFSPAPNGYGVWIGNHSQFVVIAPMDTFRNVISGNTNGGIFVSDSSHHVNILGNIVGLNRLGDAPIPNGNYGGICIQNQCDSVAVFDNRIGGNRYGIYILESCRSSIQNNWIGMAPEFIDPLTGNEFDGVFIADESYDNCIRNNFIWFNRGAGVRIYGAEPLRNRISHNSIAHNQQSGILYDSGGANVISAPTITSVTGSSVSGTAIADAMIEIYTDSEDEGEIFQGETMSDPAGNFIWNGSIHGPFSNVTAIAINAEGSTSPFSKAVLTEVEQPAMNPIPESFSLNQNYPNPFNPSTTIEFALPRPCFVTLTIYNMMGEEVTSLITERLTAGIHRCNWDARGISSGIYLYRLEATDHSPVLSRRENSAALLPRTYVQSRKLILMR